MNLDTLSSDSSEEDISDSGRSFHSLIVWGSDLYVHILENIDHCLWEEATLIEIFTSIGCLKGKGVPISATPSLGNKVFMCMYLLIFRMLVHKWSLQLLSGSDGLRLCSFHS